MTRYIWREGNARYMGSTNKRAEAVFVANSTWAVLGLPEIAIDAGQFEIDIPEIKVVQPAEKDMLEEAAKYLRKVEPYASWQADDFLHMASAVDEAIGYREKFRLESESRSAWMQSAKELSAENDRLQAELEAATKANGLLRSETDRLGLELRELRMERAEVRKRVDEAMLGKNVAEAELAAVQAERDKFCADCDFFGDELAEVKKELENNGSGTVGDKAVWYDTVVKDVGCQSGNLIASVRDMKTQLAVLEARSGMDSGNYEKLEKQLAEAQEEVRAHNVRMANVPSLGDHKPECAEGLRFLAKWFDAMYGDVGTGKDTVQQDLRRWANERESQEKQLAEARAQRDELLQTHAIDQHDLNQSRIELAAARAESDRWGRRLDSARGELSTSLAHQEAMARTHIEEANRLARELDDAKVETTKIYGERDALVAELAEATEKLTTDGTGTIGDKAMWYDGAVESMGCASGHLIPAIRNMEEQLAEARGFLTAANKRNFDLESHWAKRPKVTGFGLRMMRRVLEGWRKAIPLVVECEPLGDLIALAEWANEIAGGVGTGCNTQPSGTEAAPPPGDRICDCTRQGHSVGCPLHETGTFPSPGELKPCPFCNARLVVYSNLSDREPPWKWQCPNCGLETRRQYLGRQGAVEAANLRVPCPECERNSAIAATETAAVGILQKKVATLTKRIAELESASYPFDREFLGKLVRQVWIAWAETQPDLKESWTASWDNLDERFREVDRQIGEEVASVSCAILERELESRPAPAELKDQPLTFRELQDQVRPWVKYNFGVHPTIWPLLGCVEELGELAHAVLKGQQGIRTGQDHEADAKDAIGDLVIFLLDYCSSRNFDLQKIVEETWAKVQKRDWKADPVNGSPTPAVPAKEAKP